MLTRIVTGLMMGLICMALSFSVSAQQTSGSDGVKNTCEVSGGTFTGSESGNWACCWDDWGCYGCHSGICKIKCHNARCRKANSINRITTRQQRVEGLAPAGKRAPIAPKVSKTKPSQKH